MRKRRLKYRPAQLQFYLFFGTDEKFGRLTLLEENNGRQKKLLRKISRPLNENQQKNQENYTT